jgi:hypothetical protein
MLPSLDCPSAVRSTRRQSTDRNRYRTVAIRLPQRGFASPTPSNAISQSGPAHGRRSRRRGRRNAARGAQLRGVSWQRPGELDPDTLLPARNATSGSVNQSCYSKPRLDLILDNGRNAVIENARQTLYLAAEMIIAKRPVRHLPIPPRPLLGLQRQPHGRAASARRHLARGVSAVQVAEACAAALSSLLGGKAALSAKALALSHAWRRHGPPPPSGLALMGPPTERQRAGPVM